MAISDDFADAITVRDIDILRFEASERRRILSLLRELEAELVALLKDIDPTEPAQAAARRARIMRLAEEVRKISRAAYRRIAQAFDASLIEVSQIVGTDTVETANRIAGIRLMRGGIAKAQAKGLVENLLVQGATKAEWWDAQAESLSRRFLAAVREKTLTTEEGLTAIVRQVKGTAMARYRDGLRPVTDNQAQALIRTAIQQTVNDSRWSIYQQNSDVLAGVQAINPLDATTSPICRARAGNAWTMEGGPFPESGTVGRFPGPPPWHWGCRTRLIPIFKAVGNLSRVRGGRGQAIRNRMERAAASQRAALDGKPAKNATFAEMLQQKTKSEQENILGPGRFELWERGQISMADLIDQTGRPLTLDELRRQIAG